MLHTFIVQNAEPLVRRDPGRSGGQNLVPAVLPEDGVLAQVLCHAGQQRILAFCDDDRLS